MVFPWFSRFLQMFEFDQERALLRRRRNSGTMQESFGKKWIFYMFFFRYFLIFYDMLNWIEQTSEKYRKRGHCKACGVLMHLTCWDWGLWCVTVFMRARWDQEFAVLVCWSVFVLFFNVLKHLKTLKMAIYSWWLKIMMFHCYFSLNFINQC